MKINKLATQTKIAKGTKRAEVFRLGQYRRF